MVDQKVTLPITGMTCTNCAMNIEKAINRKVKGIVTATVNFATERAFVRITAKAFGKDRRLPITNRYHPEHQLDSIQS